MEYVAKIGIERIYEHDGILVSEREREREREKEREREREVGKREN